MVEFTKGQYSQLLDDEMWGIPDYDYEQDYEEVLKKLDDSDFFRPFSERLLAFYNDALDGSLSADEAKSDLQKRAGKSLNRNSIANWFSGGTEPKYGDNDRRNMFAIAFALKLDCEQTERFFNKVFLDKAFNKRNVNEFIYLYCIFHKKTLLEAESLIDKLSNLELTNAPLEQTEHTQFLAATASKDLSEDELINFISEHPHNFSINNTAAKAHKKRLLERSTVGSAVKSGLAQQEYERRKSELADEKDASGFGGKDPKSIDFLLYMIMGVDYVQKKNDEVISIREKFPRKEISNQFPDKQSLSSTDPSSYVLRKEIILLYFYDYWVSCFLDGQITGDYDDFTEELNGILYECGFSPLYVGNPYDWFFLYCSSCVADGYTPLDRFRGILGSE